MKISEWLDSATRQLRATNIDSARLDAELLLTHTLDTPREWILAHIDTSLQTANLQKLGSLLIRRLDGEPMAYILGHKEFYGRDFIVTPDVLIPRPETEQLVEMTKQAISTSRANPISPVKAGLALNRQTVDDEAKRGGDGLDERTLGETITILDVGTGSGAIAVTLALEIPNAHIFASDVSKKALLIAKRNARILGAEKIEFIQSDLLQIICNKPHSRQPQQFNMFDIIVANLPYVAREWESSLNITYEPEIALFAGDEGLELIKKLIQQTPKHLKLGGLLILELDPRQVNAIKKFATNFNFIVLDERPFVLTLQRRCIPETAKQK
ncbi:peptide chain release factor N(5)-glutamine methyltransferase [Candidatus Saccharibacteria bacterium]|nr:peptide chain release factor N(5)-glutamine methyltransferase [Candidatus Saccharibacteria bacterium]